jgi:hypothetical protein
MLNTQPDSFDTQFCHLSLELRDFRLPLLSKLGLHSSGIFHNVDLKLFTDVSSHIQDSGIHSSWIA